MNLLSLFLAQAEPGWQMQLVDNLARSPISKVVLFATTLTVLRLVLHPILIRTPLGRRGIGNRIGRFLSETADAGIYASLVVFLLIRPFAIQTFYIPSGSMIDTLRILDTIVANKLIYRYSDPVDGDIVVFKPPAKARGGATNDSDFIKRLIGKPGDIIEIKDNILYRNHKRISEPYVDYTAADSQGTQVLPPEKARRIKIPDFRLVQDGNDLITLSSIGGFQFTGQKLTGEYEAVEDKNKYNRYLTAPAAPIPPGYYLMMGDNRNGSFDGRFWGLVPRQSIVGKAWFIWLPLSRFRVF